MANLGGLRSVDWNETRLQHFEKNFYVEDQRVSARNEKEVKDFQHAEEIRVGFYSPNCMAQPTDISRSKFEMFLAQSPRSTRLGFLST
jgi:ATP-dependent RNA helicase DDX5/DBP2